MSPSSCGLTGNALVRDAILLSRLLRGFCLLPQMISPEIPEEGAMQNLLEVNEVYLLCSATTQKEEHREDHL